jgi:hypothetical protein
VSRRLNEAVAALEDYRRAKAEPNLFDAIERVAEHAGSIWRLEALNALEELARTRETLTVEYLSPLCSTTYDRRALGGILREGKRRRWIEAAGYVNAGAERHGRPVMLWRSLIFRGEP